MQTTAFGYPVPQDPRKELVTTGDQFERMYRQLEATKLRCFDHETSGLSWWQHAESCGIAFSCLDDHGIMSWYVPYRHATGERQLELPRIAPSIQRLFADPFADWTAHNLKFDEHMNRREGWHIAGKRYCTQMAARLYDENRLIALKYRAATDLGILNAHTWEDKLEAEVVRLSKLRRMGKKLYKARFGYSEIPIDLAGYYACHDVDYAMQLRLFYERWGLSSHYERIWTTEMQLIEVLCDMEEWGMPIDVPYLQQLGVVLDQRMAQLEQQLWALGIDRFELGSDDQLRRFLYGYDRSLRLPITKKTRSGAPSVEGEVIELFREAHPSMALIIEWRNAAKIRNTWTDSILEKLDANHILHGQLRSDGTNTGRLASSGPNLHNFAHDDDDRALLYSGKTVEDGGVDPWSIRRAFVMRPGMPRLYFDYSQIELRMIAWYTRDPIMVETYLQGGDIHERTQHEIGAMLGTAPIKRRPAKVINFGISYCMGEKGLSRQAKIPIQLAKRFMSAFLSRYPQVVKYRQSFWHQCRLQGNQFTNIFGRRRWLPNLSNGEQWQINRAERQAFGSLIQGTAAELNKESLVRLHQWIRSEGLPIRLVSTVHDDIWLDCPQELVAYAHPRIKQIMEHYPEFAPIPTPVDGQYSTTNWAEKADLAEGLQAVNVA